MCQLLGLCANKPVSIRFSLSGFVRRGGATGDHSDGWGVACSDGAGWARHFDCAPASASPRMEQLLASPLRARNFVVHIRKATLGKVAPENCHPFLRTLWGRSWAFAHNGHLEHFAPQLDGRYLPEGSTDSELAFCFLLQSLHIRFGDSAPDAAQLFEAIEALARSVAHFGTFNFLLSDGIGMYAFCSTDLHVLHRAYPFSRARLIDLEHDIDFASHCHLDDRMSVIATHPLTEDEPWEALGRGELRYFRHGAQSCSGAGAHAGLAIAV